MEHHPLIYFLLISVLEYYLENPTYRQLIHNPFFLEPLPDEL